MGWGVRGEGVDSLFLCGEMGSGTGASSQSGGLGHKWFGLAPDVVIDAQPDGWVHRKIS
jgi:hypothetical protein